MMKKTVRGLRIFVCLCLSLALAGFVPRAASAAAKYPSGIRLNQKAATVLIGKTVKLKATITPANAKKSSISWKSSNSKVASVSSTGVVKVTGEGTAKITAKTVNGKKAVYTVKGVRYSVSKGKITVATPEGKRTYIRYNQNGYSDKYYSSCGCVTVAVAIAASGFGKKYTPVDIHKGGASKKYSEKYALKKMKLSASLHGRASISLWTASEILKNMGVENKVVYKFSTSKAVKEIQAHLKSGKPVLVKANNKVHKGIKLANGHHALILVSIDKNGYLTWINPEGGSINYAHGSDNYCKMTLKELVKYHMSSAAGKYKTGFVTSSSTAGGYILLG